MPNSSTPRDVSIRSPPIRSDNIDCGYANETWNVVCTCAHMARYIHECSSCSRGVVPRTQRQQISLRGWDASLSLLVGERRNSLTEAFKLACKFIWVWDGVQRQRFLESQIRMGRWRAGVRKQHARVSHTRTASGTYAKKLSTR